MMNLTPEIMYRASVEKNPEFEGIFWMGVQTTGIFCRPTCTARKPKIENVEFFDNTKAAILKGYRPCKICRPLESASETPDYIKDIIKEIQDHPEQKLKDYDLVQRGLEPATVRRWFQKHHGMTFQAFQRMSRLNSAFKKLNSGESVTAAALDSGYESLSGFGDGFKTVFGISPKHSQSQKIISLKRIETPLGTMVACAGDEGICMLEFSDRKALPTELRQISEYFSAPVVQSGHPHFQTLEAELEAYFAGSLKQFGVPLAPVGTAFQKKVWEVLRQIPYGDTRSYREQAGVLGNAAAVRAVANANGLNKISIIIPCHRVVGSDGKLTGYGGGIWRKQKLLELERQHL